MQLPPMCKFPNTTSSEMEPSKQNDSNLHVEIPLLTNLHNSNNLVVNISNGSRIESPELQQRNAMIEQKTCIVHFH